jgi:hypothetical protein
MSFSVAHGKRKRKRKEKLTHVVSYRHDFEPVGLILITVLRDAIYSFMPPLGRWTLMGHE